LNNKLLRPFLRWAGGKQKLVQVLLQFVPNKESFNRYYEPFFGGGSLFFAVQPNKATLSDINSDLMNCYRQVAKDPVLVFSLLQRYARNDSREFYYRIRARSTEGMSDVGRAARFIYLNKAAFNGIYRVNKYGVFNVPYGPSANGIALPSREVLTSSAHSLRKAKIIEGDFQKALAKASAGDFVYLDPPYPPRSDTAYFTHYSADRFAWDQQVRVAEIFYELSRRGCLVMLSNAHQKKVVSLYSQFFTYRLGTMRWLGSNGDRFRVRELVVTNYNFLEFPH
jgi:DNA adenine methylase